jgi:hypothetical protein
VVDLDVEVPACSGCPGAGGFSTPILMPNVNSWVLLEARSNTLAVTLKKPPEMSKLGLPLVPLLKVFRLAATTPEPSS